ncbi:hypothetical protein XAB3213_550002 [Xanthomonas citri pv. bilvae]|nr:hypothetical protein XAB3213_550002 [Xanthomonas citri pv. bilvae]
MGAATRGLWALCNAGAGVVLMGNQVHPPVLGGQGRCGVFGNVGLRPVLRVSIRFCEFPVFGYEIQGEYLKKVGCSASSERRSVVHFKDLGETMERQCASILIATTLAM